MKGSRVLKNLGVFAAIGLIPLGIAIANWNYPFVSTNPNFSDVERVFNKMQFPGDWQEIDSSENSGIAGRQCPIESSSHCYHKSKTFLVSESVKPDDVKQVLMQTGCPAVSIQDVGYKTDPEESKSLLCSIEGLDISGGHKGPENEVYISVGT